LHETLLVCRRTSGRWVGRLWSARPMKFCPVTTGTRRLSFINSVLGVSGTNTASYEICTRRFFRG